VVSGGLQIGFAGMGVRPPAHADDAVEEPRLLFSLAEEATALPRLADISTKCQKEEGTMRNHRRKRRIFRRLALGLAVAAVAVPSAQAQLHQREAADPSDGFVLSTASYPAPDERDWPGIDPNAVPYERARSADVVPPGRRDWPGVNPNAVPNEARPGPGPLHVDPPNQVASKPDGFNWGDASMGAVFALSVMLLGAGLLVTMIAARRVPNSDASSQA
jgi:hypothetical protein